MGNGELRIKTESELALTRSYRRKAF